MERMNILDLIISVLNANLLCWNDWHWQMKQKAVCSKSEVLASLGLIPKGAKLSRRVGLTPYNIKLLLNLRETDPEGYMAERLQSLSFDNKKGENHQWTWAKRHDLWSSRIWSWLPIPTFFKTLFTGRGSDTGIKGLERMYPKIDVIMGAANCARNCSFCFREVGNPQGEASQITGGMSVIMKAVKQVISCKTPHVLITGGDPLTKSNKQLEQMLMPLVESETIQVLRLATRMVVDLPMRFYDQELLEMLKKFAEQMKDRNASFRIVTQINHACELTSEAIKALKNIQSCGIEVMAQITVLRGVNDNLTALHKLLMELDRLGVRNHHLFHSMPVPGTEHLRVPYRRFRRLVSCLHQWLPTTAVPHASVVTLVGKIPIMPKRRWILSIPFTNRLLCRSFRGEWHLFKDSWDIIRHLQEAGVAIAAISILLFASWFVKPTQKTDRISSYQEINRVVMLADDIGYPDAWARQRFSPFVLNSTLYTPIQGL